MTSSPDERSEELPQPSALPPNPSVGELVTEIDRARHDAARTAAALVDRVNIKSRAQRYLHDHVGILRTLRWDGRRLRHDLRAGARQLTETVPSPITNAVSLVRRLPRWVSIGVPVMLLLRTVIRRRRRS